MHEFEDRRSLARAEVKHVVDAGAPGRRLLLDPAEGVKVPAVEGGTGAQSQ